MEQHLEASPRLTVHAIPLPPPAGAPSPRERVLRAVSILFHSNDSLWEGGWVLLKGMVVPVGFWDGEPVPYEGDGGVKSEE